MNNGDLRIQSHRSTKQNDTWTRLIQNDPTLLELFWSRHVDMDIEALASSLKENCTLRKLFLRGNNIGPHGALQLVDALQDNDTVETIQLGDNHVGNQGASGFGKLLRDNKTIKSLFLMNNSVSDEGTIELAAGLEENDTLETLFLCNNNIGSEGATALSRMIIRNKGLRRIYLYGNPIGGPGKQQLVRALERNFFLEELDIGDRSWQKGPIDYYIKLNKAGRRLLRADCTVPDTLWVNVAAKVTSVPSLLYYFVREKPELFKNRVES